MTEPSKAPRTDQGDSMNIALPWNPPRLTTQAHKRMRPDHIGVEDEVVLSKDWNALWDAFHAFYLEANRRISDATSRAEMAEAEAHRTHMEVRADYDKTVADAWRAAVAKEREYAETRLDALESLKELLAKQIMGFPGYAQCAACGTSWGVGMPEEHEKSCPVDLGLKIIEAALSESENEKSQLQNPKPAAQGSRPEGQVTEPSGAAGAGTTENGIRTFDALRQVTAALESLFALVNGEAPSLLRDDHHYTMAVEAIEAGNEALKVPAISNARIIEGENAIDVLDAARERLYMLVLERAGPRPVPIERLIALVEEEFRARNVPSLFRFPRQPGGARGWMIDETYLAKIAETARLTGAAPGFDAIEAVLVAVENHPPQKCTSQGNTDGPV